MDTKPGKLSPKAPGFVIASTVMFMWMSSENASVKTFAAAIHAALAAVALTPKFMSNPDVNVGVMINSTSP